MHQDRNFWLAAIVTLLAVIAAVRPNYGNRFYSLPKPGMFVSWYRENALWPALMHKVSGLTSSIQRANVLLLGNSKVLLGLSASQLNERFGPRNIKFFNLGIEGGEGIFAANHVINRLNLTNKVLLIHLDDFMLSTYESENMHRAEEMDWFEAMTAVYSIRANAVIETMLDHLGIPQLEIKNSIALHARLLPRGIRDPVTGDALPVSRHADVPGIPIYSIEPALPEKMLPISLLHQPHVGQIFSHWHARNMRLVFVTIPYGAPNGGTYTPALPAAAAREFGGTAIALDWHGLTSTDYIHLDRKGREKATNMVADGLAGLSFL
jgi:hypothetical protein